MKKGKIIIGNMARIYNIDYDKYKIHRVYFEHKTSFYDEMQIIKNFVSPLRLLHDIRKYNMVNQVKPEIIRLLEARELAEKI